MLPFDIREPINTMSHGAGMMMALPVTWLLWKKCGKLHPCALSKTCGSGIPAVRRDRDAGWPGIIVSRHFHCWSSA